LFWLCQLYPVDACKTLGDLKCRFWTSNDACETLRNLKCRSWNCIVDPAPVFACETCRNLV
jgi:hypothetical protein